MSETDDDRIGRMIEELERTAATVLEKKRKLRPRRPIVIEFAGAPKSGKSSCIGSLDIFLRRNGFRTRVLTERASVCPISGKFDPLFNVWTAGASLNQLAHVLDSEPRDLDVVILDRGFFDALCWFEWQHREGFLRTTDFQNFVNFYTTPRLRTMIDTVFLFEASPETSITREYKNLLTRKEGSIMRKAVLEGYMEAAKHVMSGHKGKFRAVEVFSTDEPDQNQVSYELTKRVIAQLDEAADERIGFVQRTTLDPSLPESFEYRRIVDAMSRQLDYRLRGEVEHDNGLVQFIPVAVVRDKTTGHVLAGMKAKKAMGIDSPERDKVLLWFGGHLRQEDASLFDHESTLDVLKHCVHREVKEEIGIDVSCVGDNPLCIWVRDGSKSERHIAVVFDIRMDLEKVRVTVDDTEFLKEGDSFLAKVEPIDEANVRSLLPHLDSWSRNIAERVLHVAANQGPFKID